MTAATGFNACPLCGTPYSLGGLHGHGICAGRYHFTPTPLTEADIRRIIREELARAAEPQNVERNGGK